MGTDGADFKKGDYGMARIKSVRVDSWQHVQKDPGLKRVLKRLFALIGERARG